MTIIKHQQNWYIATHTDAQGKHHFGTGRTHLEALIDCLTTY